ncbi:DNA-directed RNA polymerase subunit alpha C-terminal domain-containing protein [Metabacillus sp. SLBN-84]
MIDNHYPFNLIRAIHGEDKENDTPIETIYIKGLYEQLLTLSEEERTLLTLRFRDNLTLKACGERYGKTYYWAGPIIKRALRKMRHRSRSLHYQGVSTYELRRAQIENEKLARENQQLREALQAVDDSHVDPHAVILLAHFVTPEHVAAPIGELNLNVRAYNALARAGILTVKDLISVPEETLIHMRNIGEKTVHEIKAKIRAYILLPDSADEKEDAS